MLKFDKIEHKRLRKEQELELKEQQQKPTRKPSGKTDAVRLYLEMSAKQGQSSTCQMLQINSSYKCNVC